MRASWPEHILHIWPRKSIVRASWPDPIDLVISTAYMYVTENTFVHSCSTDKQTFVVDVLWHPWNSFPIVDRWGCEQQGRGRPCVLDPLTGWFSGRDSATIRHKHVEYTLPLMTPINATAIATLLPPWRIGQGKGPVTDERAMVSCVVHLLI
jgi:hypothetical protein